MVVVVVVVGWSGGCGGWLVGWLWWLWWMCGWVVVVVVVVGWSGGWVVWWLSGFWWFSCLSCGFKMCGVVRVRVRVWRGVVCRDSVGCGAVWCCVVLYGGDGKFSLLAMVLIVLIMVVAVAEICEPF